MNDQKLWSSLLKQSPKDSILMGGAIVDCIAGVKPKDYDIFYPYKFPNKWDKPNNWKLTDADFNDPEWVKEHDAWYAQGEDAAGQQTIASVIEYLVDGQHTVQLIGVWYDDAREHLKNFDHSLTLGYYSDSRGLFVHPKVFKSFDDHIITYVNKNQKQEQKDRSFIRALKKADKYGGEWIYSGF